MQSTLFGFDTAMTATPESKCVKCEEPLGDDTYDWQKYCSHCYKEYKDAEAAAPKRACGVCGEDNVPSTWPEWRTNCAECFKKGQENMRACRICAHKKINPCRPAYVKLCAECWKASMKNCRPCKGCGEKKIGCHEPEWKSICGPCYKSGKRSNMICV